MARTWSRPYLPGKARRVVALWELGALAFFHQTTMDLFELGPRTGGYLGATLAVLWLSGCWRLAQMGLYTGSHGLQVRGLLTRRTMPWTDVERIITHEVTYELGRLRIPAGRTVTIELADGRRVNSTLWADGVDFKFRPALFQKVCEDLRRRHLSTNPASVELR